MTETSPETKLTRVFSRTPSSWDPQDDLLLRHLKEQQKLGWKEIASHFTNRTPNACQFRWRRLRSGSLKSATPATATVTQTPGSSSTSTPPASVTTPNISYKEPSTSPSTSPPPIASSIKSKPISVPTYNQWSFNGSQKVSSSIIKNDDTGTDPLSSSLNSMSSDEGGASAMTKLWTQEEDELLMTRRKRSLSFAELSILLPSRTEVEIYSRIDELENRSRSHSVIEIKENTKLQYLSTTPQRRQRHSHSYQHHTTQSYTPTIRRKSERSFSVSSQTSVGSFSLSGDFIRSNSFSINPPVLFNNLQQQAVSERYTLRKESISNSQSRPFMKSRSNSIFKTCLTTSAIDDDDDEDEELEEKKKDQKLPPLGVLFNDYFAK